MTLYNHVAQNKLKSGLLVLVFLGLIALMGWTAALGFDAPWILPAAVVIALVQVWASYYYSDSIALAISRARPAEGSEFVAIRRLVDNLAITAGLPAPRLYIIDDTAPNAFATGRDPQHAAIAVTTGLLQKLEKSELEGVLAHELAHIGNYDIRFMSMVVVLVGIITLVSDFVLRWSWRFGGDRNESGGGQARAVMMLIGLVLAILAPIIGLLLQLAVSRKREFMADSTGALLTRYPEGLASALRKIASDREPLEAANKATAHLYIANPLKGEGQSSSWLANLFSTHPPVEARVKALLSGGGAERS